MKKCIETNDDIHIALLQIRSNSIRAWAAKSSYAVIQPSNMRHYTDNKIGYPINSDNNEGHYEALIKGQTRNDMNYDTARNYDLFSIWSTVAVQ